MLKLKNDKKIRLSKKHLKSYYHDFYNENFYRDFRYIPDDNSKARHLFNEKKLSYKSDAESRALHFLTSAEHKGDDGLLGGEITYYKSFDEYKTGDIMLRWSDRLFFDIDIEDSRVEMIKEEFKRAYHHLYGDELECRLEDLRKDFRDLIFNSDLLKPTFTEAKNLCLFLEDLGLKPFLIFSGSKGFHINIFYEECRLQNLSQVSRLFAKTFSDKLDLKYLDWAVFDRNKAQRRLQRCQYAIHSKTGLMTIPIPEIYDYDEAIKVIQKNHRRPVEFNLEEYSSKSGEFRESLLTNDKQFQRMNERQRREKEWENQRKRKEMVKKYGKGYRNYQDISMMDIFSHYGGEVIREDSLKAIVRCPFHSDRNPSAVIFKDSNYFYCSSCGKTLNYYGFISEMEGTEDHSEIMSKVDDFMK